LSQLETADSLRQLISESGTSLFDDVVQV